jgi:tetratricopeptide (TPR) repeat protein
VIRAASSSTVTKPFKRSALAILIVSFVASLSIGVACGQGARTALETPTGTEALPEPFVPRRLRDEMVEDQMHASALFTEGRLMFRREQFEQALQRYERAYRYADGPTTILDEIIPLAFSLGRMDEAARYGRRAKAPSHIDPFVWRRLALHLTEKEDYAEALRLYGFAARPSAEFADAVPSVITQFETGRLLYLSDRFAEAVVPLAQVSQVLQQADPPAAEKPAVEALLGEREITFALIAEAFLRAKQPQRAAEMFRLAYRDRPDADILNFHLARVAAAEDKSDDALERLREYLKSGDTAAGTGPYELLVELLTKQGNPDEALKELEQVAGQQPQNAFVVYQLGQLHLQRQAPDAAAQQFERLMQIRPLVDGYRGLLRARTQQQDAPGIVRLLADAVPRLNGVESLGESLDALIADAALLNRVVETAQKDFLSDTSASPAPTQRAVALAIAELLSHRDDPAAADPFYERAAGQGDEADPAIWLAWGMQRLVGEQPARAIEIFQAVLDRVQEASQQGPVHFYLSAALALDNRFDEALAAARRAAELVPQVPAIQLRPAWVLLLAKRWPEAAKEYGAFIDRFGDRHDSPELRQAIREAKTSLSSIYVHLEQNDEAERLLEEVLDEFPDDVGAHNDLGYLWADRGIHLQRAVRMTRYAVEQEPDNVAYRDSYGWALFQVGKFAEALEQLRKAANVDSPDGVILDHLGDALRETEGRAPAVDTWRRAIAALGDSEPQRRIRLEQKIQQAGSP